MLHFCSCREMREMAVRGVDGPGLHILDVSPESWRHLPHSEDAFLTRKAIVQEMYVMLECRCMYAGVIRKHTSVHDFVPSPLTSIHTAGHRGLHVYSGLKEFHVKQLGICFRPEYIKAFFQQHQTQLRCSK